MTFLVSKYKPSTVAHIFDEESRDSLCGILESGASDRSNFHRQAYHERQTCKKCLKVLDDFMFGDDSESDKLYFNRMHETLLFIRDIRDDSLISNERRQEMLQVIMNSCRSAMNDTDHIRPIFEDE